jgi:hypothetical protein
MYQTGAEACPDRVRLESLNYIWHELSEDSENNLQSFIVQVIIDWIASSFRGFDLFISIVWAW